jgi:type I restriction enzyme, S subunit
MNTERPIGELIECLIDYRGKTPPKTTSGVPLITAKVIKNGQILTSGLEFIADEIYDKWMRRGLPRQGDILITTEAPLGEVAQIGQDARVALAQRVILLRPNPNEVDPQFLFHFLRSPVAQARLRRRASGTTVTGIRQPELRSVEIALLPRSSQLKVGRILDVLDTLVENNRRRILLLEQMAQAIYREWFVDFRYPGHAGSCLVDSLLGLVPEGWEVTTCGAALAVLGGGTPSKKVASYWDDGTIPWYTPSDLTRTRTRFAAEPESRITELGLEKSSARLFPAGSLLMTSRATLGVLAIATTDASCNQGFIVILPDDRWPPTFMYEWLRTHAVELEALGTGATFKEITKGAFKRVPFLVPATDVLKAFRAAVTPIDDEVRVLEAANRNLVVLRDLLLPRLVTGQLDVATLDLGELLAAAT